MKNFKFKFKNKIKIIKCDISKYNKKFSNYFKNIDTVFHCWCFSRYCAKYK